MYLAGPLHYVAQSWIYAMDSKAPRLGAEVFMHFGKALRSEDFSSILQYQTAQHLHVPMGLRMWRQMVKALLRRIVNIDIDDEGDHADDALDEMFGHTTGTARSRYGLTWNDLPTLHEDMLTDLFNVSKRFWAWLADPASKAVGPRPDISYTEIHEAVSTTLGKLQLAASQQTAIIQETASSHARMLEMLQLTHEKIDRTHQAVLSAQHGHPSLVQAAETLDVGFSRIHGLRLYLQDSSATFKSTQQALAIELISRGCPHILVVLPTGAGKTAIYGSPGYVEKAGFRLVIIPYRSLFDQVTQEARSKGLPYAIFPSNDIDLFRSRLVFVSLERCAENDFRTWCIANKNANLLRGIIVDEAHDIIMAANYRHSFKKLMKLTDLNVQIALLTATLSPRSEVALLEVRHLSALLTILNVFAVIANGSLIGAQDPHAHPPPRNSVPCHPRRRRHHRQRHFVHGAVILSPKSRERYYLRTHHSLLRPTGWHVGISCVPRSTHRRGTQRSHVKMAIWQVPVDHRDVGNGPGH